MKAYRIGDHLEKTLHGLRHGLKHTSIRGLGAARQTRARLILALLLLALAPAPAGAALEDQTALRLPPDVQVTYTFAVGDVNGDGSPDVVTANGGRPALLLNDGGGVFTDATTTALPEAPETTVHATLADVDGDHDLDLVLSNANGPIRLYTNAGGTFTDETAGRIPPGIAAGVVSGLADLDGDHDLDLVVGSRGGESRLFVNNGGVFDLAAPGRLPVTDASVRGLLIRDLNGDGAVDLFFSCDKGGNRLLMNNGLGAFTDESGARLPAVQGEYLNATVADIDGNGAPDLVLAAGADGVRIFTNDGSGHFTDTSATLLPTLADYTIAVAVADMDEDGRPDIVAANAGQDHILLGNGSGFTVAPADFLPMDDQRSFGLAVFDGDGDLDLDLLLATPGGQNRYLENAMLAPRVRANISPTYVEVGDTVNISVQAHDEDGVASLTLAVRLPGGALQPLSHTGGSATFIPSAAGAHALVVTATDTPGNTAVREFPFLVQEADTDAPTVTVTVDKPSPLLQGHTVTVHVSATDNRGVVSRTLKVNGATTPLDVTGSATLVVTTVGPYTFAASAADAAGNVGNDTQTVTVAADTLKPAVTLSASPDPADIAHPVDIAVTASDNVAVTSLTTSVTGPTYPGGYTLTLDGTGHAQFIPFLPGIHTVSTTARDLAGNETVATTTFDAVGVPDTVSPVVTLAVSPHTVAMGGSVSITVTATDNVTVSSLSATLNGAPLLLDAAGKASFTPPAVGVYTLAARAEDPSGNVGAANDSFRAVNPAGDSTPPTVTITSPGDDAQLTSMTDIIGTVSDPALSSYTLAYAPTGTSDFVTFATGDRDITNGALAAFDPTLLANGFYTLRLTASDLNGNSASADVVVSVTGALKLGQFTISFKDKALNIGRFPLDVTRGYDSRKRGVKGDFGYGWNISLSEAELIENRSPGDLWSMRVTPGFFPLYTLVPLRPHTVTVKLTEDKEERFAAEPDPKQQQLLPINYLNGMKYIPIGEAKGTLLPSSTPDYFDGLSIINFDTFEPYNPSSFIYQAEDGYQYQFSETGYQSLRHTLSAITDPSGTTVTLSNAGFTRSDGLSLAFTRDSQGRITKITDPMGLSVTYQYDAQGNLATVTDAENNKTTFIYDANHFLTEIRDPLNRPIQRQEYDADGRLIAITDASGNRVEYAYDITNNTQIVRDRRGNPSIYEYDGRGNVTRETKFPTVDGVVTPAVTLRAYDIEGQLVSELDPLGNETSFTYSPRGELLQKVRNAGTGGLNLTETFTYDTAGRVLTRTDPRGAVVRNTYDADGNLLTRTARNGGVTSFQYDGRGNVTRMTDALGNFILYTYDGQSRRTAEEQWALGGASPLRRMTFTYDANGNKLTETVIVDIGGTPTAATKTFTYDKNGRVTAETDPLGNVKRTEYDPLGNKTAEVDPLGNRTTYTYNERSELVRTDFADGTFLTYTYDGDGNRTAEKDRNGNTTTFSYDALNRLIRVDFADGSVREKRYDAAGNLLAEIDELGNRMDHASDALSRRVETLQPPVFDAAAGTTKRPQTTYEYDANGNKTAMTDANGHRTEYVYDAEDRLITTVFPDGRTLQSGFDLLGNETVRTDAAGLTTNFEYDALKRLIAVRMPKPSAAAPRPVTLYAYDALGNLTAQTDANGHTTLFTYDLAGRRTTRELPGGERETFAYDAAGRVTAHTDFNGDITAYAYNPVGRKTRTTYAGGATATITYLGEGQQSSATDSRGATAYTYDSRNRLLSATDPDGKVVRYTYQPSGKQASVVGPAGTTTHAYDALQRLSTVTDANNGVTTYGYDAVGNLVSEAKPDGTLTTRTYNSRNQLLTVITKKGGTTLASFTYTLDANGLRTAVAETGGSVVYTYDGNYRLVAETRTGANAFSATYTYDAVGNRLSVTRGGATETSTYDANDRLLSAGPETYAYDANGNQIERRLGADLTTFDYDAAGRLVRSVAPNGAITSYGYDHEGRRISMAAGGSSIRFVLDTNSTTGVYQVLAEQDAAGNVLRSYTHGGDLISQQIGGTASYFQRDGTGSTRALTGAAGAVTDTYTFDAFGRETASSGSTLNRYRFAGAQYDANVGMYYLRARYYDQETGRFVSMDPEAGDPMSPMSLHRYLYAFNNPVNFTDPTGRFSLIEVNISISIQSTIQSIYTKNLIKFFFNAAKIAFCTLEPAYQMQALGLDMIARNLPGGEQLVDQARNQIAEGFQAIGAEIASTYQNIASDIIDVKIEVGGLLKDIYDAYTSGTIPVPVPEEVAKLLEFKDKLEEWMGKFSDACNDIATFLNGNNCDKFTVLAKNADDIVGLIPDF